MVGALGISPEQVVAAASGHVVGATPPLRRSAPLPPAQQVVAFSAGEPVAGDRGSLPGPRSARYPPRVLGRAFSLRVAAIVTAAAALLALAPAGSAAPGSASIFVHSAKGGHLSGGRLTLHGVSRRVTWLTNRGRSGVVSVARLHRRLFSSRTPSATGALHVANYRGGDEPTFKLSRPRYKASRHTVSYKVKRLNKRPLPGRTARGSQHRMSGRFGPASLSIVGAPRVTGGDNGGLDCRITLQNNTPHLFQATGESKWPTDTWDPGIPFQAYLDADGSVITWGSDGGLLRGCSVSGTWTIVPWQYEPNLPSATFTLTTTNPWNGQWSYTCTSSNPQFSCEDHTTQNGSASWSIEPSQ